jgi:hypothetical protein
MPNMTELTYIAVVSQGATVNAFPFATRLSGSPVDTGFDLLSGPANTAGQAVMRAAASGGQSQTDPLTNFNDSFNHTFLGTWKTSEGARLYADTPTNFAVGGATSGTITHGQNLKIGNRGGTRWTGFIGLLLVGTRQNLNAGFQLLENPWQIFVPQTKAIISLGGSAVTLSADLGVYSLVGTNTELNRALAFSADLGAYSLAGAAATLSRGGFLSSDSGAYNLTGVANAFVISRNLSSDSGAYNFTGSAAELLRARNLSADSGSYNLTGFAADLSRTSGQFLSADSGAYSITGSDATLNRTRSLSADSGSYNLTGSSAELNISRSLSADSGAYNVTGAAATLTQAKVISADAGSYALDGQAASFIRTYNLLAAAGAFNTTGSDASLLTSRSFSADSGAYSIDGVAATLTRVSASGYPDPGDVREGVVYGPGGIYVGTLKVGGKVLYIFDD